MRAFPLLFVMFLGLATLFSGRANCMFRCMAKNRASLYAQINRRLYSEKYHPTRKELNNYMNKILSSLSRYESSYYCLRGDCQTKADSLAQRIKLDYAGQPLELWKYFIDWRPSGWNNFNYHAFLVVRGMNSETKTIEYFALDPFLNRSLPVMSLDEFLQLFPSGRIIARRPGWDIDNFDLIEPGPRFRKKYKATIEKNASKLDWRE